MFSHLVRACARVSLRDAPAMRLARRHGASAASSTRTQFLWIYASGVHACIPSRAFMDARNDGDSDTDHSEETKKYAAASSARMTYKIVLTGGPCGGKSTAMSTVARTMRKRGFNVFLVPEVATILINGGTNFMGLERSNVIRLQSSLARTQMALEDAFEGVAEATSLENQKPSIVLCDRGLMDGSAYMTDDDWDLMLDEEGWKTVDLRDKRYDAVFHMVTAADGAEKYYTLANNAARSENAEEACRLDKRLQECWLGHHNCFVFDNSTGFEAKIDRVLNAIHTVVGLPQSDKRERKFLVDLEKCAPPEEWGVPYEDVLLEINFLRVKDKSRNIARIAKRSQRRTSSYIYSVKVVPSRAGVKPYVTERGVSAREYMNLLRYVDRKRNTVMKRQRCFNWNNSFYTLNYFKKPVSNVVVLEVRSHSVADNNIIPPFLHVEKEVSGEDTYDSHTLARKS